MDLEREDELQRVMAELIDDIRSLRMRVTSISADLSKACQAAPPMFVKDVPSGAQAGQEEPAPDRERSRASERPAHARSLRRGPSSGRAGAA